MRIGFGYDVHKLAYGESFWLGGIEIPHEKGTVAHSDGDVLLHAICDALLGAAALGDIGTHFPDTDMKYKDASSLFLLSEVIELLKNNGYTIGNIDSTICLQTPKIKKYIPDMVETISQKTSLTKDQISIKATTTEKLGFVGSEQGISAYAVVLIN